MVGARPPSPPVPGGATLPCRGCSKSLVQGEQWGCSKVLPREPRSCPGAPAKAGRGGANFHGAAVPVRGCSLPATGWRDFQVRGLSPISLGSLPAGGGCSRSSRLVPSSRPLATLLLASPVPGGTELVTFLVGRCRPVPGGWGPGARHGEDGACLLYTSDAADDVSTV